MKKKILVIDDDQDILDLTEFLLKEMGYEVVASLTADILKEVPKIIPDLILLDDWLEDTSGHEQCKILKTTEATKNIPVIIFSASTGLEKVAKDCHADGYIEKPFDVDYLEEIVGNLLVANQKVL